MINLFAVKGGQGYNPPPFFLDLVRVYLQSTKFPLKHFRTCCHCTTQRNSWISLLSLSTNGADTLLSQTELAPHCCKYQAKAVPPSPDLDHMDHLDNASVAQLREQIRVLAQDQRDDQEVLRRILAQLATLAAQVSQQDPICSIQDGTDPTFESWKLQMQGKFRVNADHFEDEEARMLYLFNRTTGNANKHLQPRYNKSPVRFTCVQEMFEHLEAIYVNPNKVRDAQFDYNRLTMKTTQTFVEFQTQFLHLAGEAQIPAESLRLDLYDRLTTQLQEELAAQLRTLDTFAKLSASCLSLDTELQRISARREQGVEEYDDSDDDGEY